MKSFALITLVFLVSATDIVVEQNNMKQMINEMNELKKSIIEKKLQEKQLQYSKVLELMQAQSESDSINDSIQLIKVSQNTYNSSTTNYTQPNSTYNYTYSNYSQPTYNYNSTNLTNSTSNTNLTNSSYPYNYTTSYPYSNGVQNYVTYDNQNDTTNSTNTNSTSITCSVGYFLSQNSTCLPCSSNCAICTSSNICLTCYQGYQLNNVGCLISSQNTTSNSTSGTNSTQVYDNSTVIDSNNTSYNNNSTQYNTTSDNSTYYNYNDTQTNYKNQSRIRQKFDQSRIHLKLRNTLNRFDNNNFTQVISYFNQSNQTQETIVLFNSSEVVQKQSLNEYYFYQNNSLVVLNQEYDQYGNIVYRSINYDFTIVVSKSQRQQNYNEDLNHEIYGTIVYGYGSFNATYNNQQRSYGSGYQNGSQYINYNNYHTASGQINYDQANNNANAQYSNYSQGSYQSYQSNSLYNDTVEKSNYQDSSNSYNNRYDVSGSANFNYDTYSKNSQYYNSDQTSQSSDDYYKLNGIGYDNYNTSTSSSSSNGNSYYNSYAGDKYVNNYNQGQNNYNSSQTNTVYAQNYSLVNESSVGYNSASDSNNVQSDWRNSSQNSYSNGFKSEDSTYIHNYTNSYNVTDVNQYQSNSNYYSSQYNGESPSTRGYSNFDSTQAHGVQVVDEDLTTTDVNATVYQYNTTNSVYDGVPYSQGFSSNKDYHLTIEDNQQQFNQLRGSKKQATGSWKEVNKKEFTSSNGQIVEEARQAITTKFNPESEGFQFDSIQSIQEQIVAGINYNIKLKYLNADSKSIIYEVVLYTIPWANKPNQVTSCSRFDQTEI